MACWRASRDRVERMAMEEENRHSICSFFFQKLFSSSRFRDVLQLSFVDKRTNEKIVLKKFLKVGAGADELAQKVRIFRKCLNFLP